MVKDHSILEPPLMAIYRFPDERASLLLQKRKIPPVGTG